MSITEELDSMLDDGEVKEEEGTPFHETIAKVLEHIPPDKVTPELLKVYESSKGDLTNRAYQFLFADAFFTIFEEMLETGNLKGDINGHLKDGTYITNPSYGTSRTLEEYFSTEFLSSIRFDRPEESVYVSLAKVLFNPDPEKNEWVTFYKGNCLKQCPVCGDDIALETNGVLVRAVGECPYSGGTIFSWELNVPSGKIVVANDLRDKFKITEDHYVNHSEGIIAASLDYASVGMSHGFVGNSCPGVHKKNSREFIIGNRPEIEDEDDEEYFKKNASGLDSEYEGTTQVASICTDLWWYSIVDYDQYIQRYGEPTEDDGVEVVECEAGVYEFLHVGLEIDTEKYPSIYTYFYKIREADPVVDYEKDYRELDVTAEQCIHNIMNSYPSKESVYSAISTMMCCIGTGEYFHPNGFFYSSYNKGLTNDEPEAEIPEKLGPHKWYPISDNYSPVCLIAQGKVKANESFIRLSFNVLHSIMNTPVEEGDQFHREDCVKLAQDMLNELYKREPNLAPDYVKEIM